MATRHGRLWVGASGYQYGHWRGVFYPEGLKPAAWLPYYAGHFDTVEINNTFYHLPRQEVFTAWRAQVPPGFRFGLKFSRFGSHMKKLKDPEQTVGLYLERAAGLGRCLGPILVQLPPRWGADPRRLADFLQAAPRRLRWAVELRDPSWYCEPVYRVLKEYGGRPVPARQGPRPPLAPHGRLDLPALPRRRQPGRLPARGAGRLRRPGPAAPGSGPRRLHLLQQRLARPRRPPRPVLPRPAGGACTCPGRQRSLTTAGPGPYNPARSREPSPGAESQP
jgi:hypothetical protein